MILNKIKELSGQNKATKPKHLVALDIGTEYVKALVGRVNGDSIEIIGVGRSHQELSDMQTGAIADIAGVVDNCDKALSDAEKQAGVDARDVVIGIAGELVKGMTSTVSLKRPQPDKHLDVEELEHIIKRVQDRALQNARQRLAYEMGQKEVDVRLVNSALVSIEIDGYKVTNPVGFQGREIAIQLFTAFAPMIHIGALERVAEELDLDVLAVAAEPFAVARSVIGTDASSNLSAILVDVGGGTTDIAVVNEGGVEGTKMFGIGGRSFTRTVSNELGVTFETAEGMKLHVGSGRLAKEEEAKVTGALDKTLDVWISGVELALSEFADLDHLPNRILLCGGGASLEQLVGTLKDSGWSKELPFTKPPSVQHIAPEQVVGIVDKTGRIHDHTYITAMGLLRVGLDTVTAVEDTPGSVRDRLNKLLSI